MAADGYTKKIRVYHLSGRIFDFVNEFSTQKIQHKVLSLGVQLILSVHWLHLEISGKSIKKWSKNVKTMLKME